MRKVLGYVLCLLLIGFTTYAGMSTLFFRGTSVGGNWYDDWGRKVVITIPKDGGAADDLCATGTLANFPVLLTEATVPAEMLDTDESYNCQADGGDLRVYTGDYSASNPATENTDRLAIEVVTVTLHATAYKLQAWVEVPTVNCVDQGSDTKITLYYNATGKSQPAQNATYGQHDVWNGGSYVAVYHMEEASGTVYNSASDSYDLNTISATPPSYQSTGKIGYAIDFDTSSETFVEYTSGAPVTAVPISMSAWVHREIAQSSSIGGVFDVDAENRFHGMLDAGDTFRNYTTAAGVSDYDISPATVTVGSLHYIYSRWSTTTSREACVNGVCSGSPQTDESIPSGIDKISIGGIRSATPSYYHEGKIDEVRFSTSIYSNDDDWQLADYHITSDPASYVVEGSPISP